MPAPPGNQFWKNRAKHGRDKLFADAQLLKETAEEYFLWCINNPWLKYEQNRNAKPVTDKETGITTWPDALIGLPTARPFTLNGLRLYIGCSQPYFIQFKHGLREKLKPFGEFTLHPETEEQAVARIKEAEDFLTVITDIEDTIYTQKFEGAAVGAYNGNIIARDLGLRDNVDTKVTGNIHLSKEPIVFE